MKRQVHEHTTRLLDQCERPAHPREKARSDIGTALEALGQIETQASASLQQMRRAQISEEDPVVRGRFEERQQGYESILRRCAVIGKELGAIAETLTHEVAWAAETRKLIGADEEQPAEVSTPQ